jgi:HEAT repeat protein
MSSRWKYVAAAAIWFLVVAGVVWAAEELPDQTIAKIASYRFGDNRASLSAVEDLVRRAGQDRGGAERLAAMLHPLLASDATLDCKQFVCRQLAVLGSKESVAPLAKLLADEQLSDMARYALESIDDPAAGQALIAALVRLPEKTTIGIINSLGNRAEAAAVPALVLRGETSVAEIRAAAIHALGQIGDEHAARALLKMKDAVADQRILVQQAFLACADKYLSQGKTGQAKAMYKMAFAESEPALIRVAAFKGLVAVADEGVDALALIQRHLGDPEPELQDAALNVVRKIRGEAATQAFVQELPKLSPPRQALLLRALADRGDRSIAPSVMSALDSEDEEVRTAAIYALGRVGGADAVKRLARFASAPPGPQQEAARESLAVLRGDDIDATIVALLENPSTKTRAQLAAALGARNSTVAVPTLLKSAQDSDSAVRVASVHSLGSLAAESDLPKLVQLLLQSSSGPVHEAAESAIVATARRIANPDQRLKVVLAALDESKDPAARVRLLPVVGKIGGARGIAAVESALKDENAEVRNAAIQTLAAWTGPEATASLLTFIKTSEKSPPQKLVALQGYIRLLALPSTRPPEETLAAYREAFGLATRLDEKRQIVANLPRVRIPETLTFLLPLLNDPDLAEDAARATVMLSTVGRRSTISRDEARAAMRQVLAVTKNQATRDAATTILESGERR